MHAQPKQKFWDHVQEEVKKEINKTHGSLNKAVCHWEKEQQRVLQAMEDGKHSGEEEDDVENKAFSLHSSQVCSIVWMTRGNDAGWLDTKYIVMVSAHTIAS